MASRGGALRSLHLLQLKGGSESPHGLPPALELSDCNGGNPLKGVSLGTVASTPHRGDDESGVGALSQVPGRMVPLSYSEGFTGCHRGHGPRSVGGGQGLHSQVSAPQGQIYGSFDLSAAMSSRNTAVCIGELRLCAQSGQSQSRLVSGQPEVWSVWDAGVWSVQNLVTTEFGQLESWSAGVLLVQGLTAPRPP